MERFERRIDDVTLTDALGAFSAEASSEAVPTCLLTSARAFTVGRLAGGSVLAPPGPVDLGAVFEARCFNGSAELRWLHEGRGRGAAVIVSDLPFDGATAVSYEELLTGTSLLWGEVAETDGVWSVLTSARTAPIAVPTALPGPHLALTYVEYLERDRYGNAVVADERFTGFATVEG